MRNEIYYVNETKWISVLDSHIMKKLSKLLRAYQCYM